MTRARPSFFVIVFDATSAANNAYLRMRHRIDRRMFIPLQKKFDLKFLKLKEQRVVIEHEREELFFTGRNTFFHIPFPLIRYVRQARPTMLFVHGFGFPIQLLALRIFAGNAKIIVQHHAEKPFIHPVKRWLQRLAYRGADAYLFASHELSEMYSDHGIIGDATKVYEMMETSTLFSRQDKAESRHGLGIPQGPVFLWIGRLDSNKDPMTMLKAFKRYRDSGAHFRLYMIYGSRELEPQVSAFIRDQALSDAVSLMGEIPHLQLQNWYSAADYFVSASHYEGAGLALCEAMGCGCIPLATRIPSFQRMTGEAGSSHLFTPGNDQQLFEILLGLKPEDREDLSQKTLQQFHSKLSFEAIAQQLQNICDALLS